MNDTYRHVQAALPPLGPKREIGYVPTSEDDAVRFMAPYAWGAFRRMRLTWVGAKAADLTQAFMLGVAICYREKWDPERGSFWSAAMWSGIHYMRNEMTIQNNRRCVDSSRRKGESIEDWLPAFQVAASAETRVAALEIIEDLSLLAQTPAEIEAVRSIVQQEVPDHVAVGVSSQRIYQVRQALLRRYHMGQLTKCVPAKKRPEPMVSVPRRVAEPPSRPERPDLGPRRDGMSIPEHVMTGKPHWQIAARFGITVNDLRESLKKFRRDVAVLAPGLRKPPRGRTTPATLQWYRDALAACGSTGEEANAE